MNYSHLIKLSLFTIFMLRWLIIVFFHFFFNCRYVIWCFLKCKTNSGYFLGRSNWNNITNINQRQLFSEYFFFTAVTINENKKYFIKNGSIYSFPFFIFFFIKINIYIIWCQKSMMKWNNFNLYLSAWVEISLNFNL